MVQQQSGTMINNNKSKDDLREILADRNHHTRSRRRSILLSKAPQSERELHITCRKNDESNRIVYKLQSFVKRRGCNKYLCLFERVDNSGTLSLIEKYLFWVFHSSFIMLFAKFIIVYTILVTLFSLLIWWTLNTYKSCVKPSFENTTYTEQFSHSYQLSWTTFSTVGYGGVSPLGTNESICISISLLCSLESFIGILFSSFCGATIFAKVTRIHAVAPITFSDPLLIRYGSGLNHSYFHDEEDNLHKASRILKKEKINCPILEFRIVNMNFHRNDGEILHASIKGAGNVLAKEAPVFNTSEMTRVKKRKSQDPANVDVSELASIDSIRSSRRRSRSNFTTISLSTTTHDSKRLSFISKSIVPAKLKFHTSELPFFKRVWIVQHSLDQHSPLLTASARRTIHHNHGHWPEIFNNEEHICKFLQFEEIIITFIGTSNDTGTPIFLQKTYDLSDVNIGYRFANILYENEDGLISVDLSKINDVNPQQGDEIINEIEDDIL